MYCWRLYPYAIHQVGDANSRSRLLRPRTEVGLGRYDPSEADVALLLRLYPDCNTVMPPWPQIQADLIRAGKSVGDWEHLSTPAILAMLRTDQAEPIDLAECMADQLSPQQKRIVDRLLVRSASYDALRSTPGCFRPSVTDESVTRALERLRDRLATHLEWGFTLTVSAAKRRATLVRLADKTTDK